MTWGAHTFQKTGRPLRCFATMSAVAEAHPLDKDTKIKTIFVKEHLLIEFSWNETTF